jgi:endoglucanase
MSQRNDGTTSLKATQKGGRGRRTLRSAGLMAACMLALLLLPPGLPLDPAPAASAQSSFNYAEALQKAIFFYEAQISGPKPPWSRVTWRGNSAMDDGDDVGHDLTGGWFDAGDHVKFGFAMASSATMLAWAGVDYRQAIDGEQQLTHYMNNLRWVNDYFIKAHTAPNELWGQVGLGGSDHAFWGSAEVMHLETNRPAFRIHSGCGGSDLAAETAAAMAASSIVFRPTDPAYANTLVAHARQLFAFAQATHPSFYVDCITDATGFYNSHFGNPNDEMAWAAVWLFRATNEAAFLQQARQHYATMCKESGTETPCFTWSQSWNDKHFGTYVLMAKLTGEQPFHVDVQRWLDYWIVGTGRTTRTTAGGLMFVHPFAAIRYATNTAFLSLVYADVLGPAHALYPRYHDFAKSQVDYALGANPRNSSYVCGFGTNPPRNPHHRTAHGTWTNNATGEPNPSVHTLYGGLVGGPNAQDDFAWSDERNLFERTEVATDFNAGLTGALARLAQEFGGSPLANFPPIEVPGNEVFIDARIQDNQPNFTTVQAFIRNRSAWPARIVSQASFRYFFNLEPNVTPAQIQVQTFTSECGGNVTSGPTLLTGSTYYVTVNCPSTIAPTGDSDHRREVQFRLTGPSDAGWDPANDHSFQGLAPTLAPTRRIVLYNAGVRIWGDEPTSTPDFSLSATPASVTVNRSASAASTIGITRSGGFTGAVALTAGPLPTGVTASFNPASATGASSILTFTANATATLGTSNVTVTGTGGGLVRTAVISLTVGQTQTPDFTLSATPASVTVNRSASAASTIGITRSGGFTGAVALTAGPLPTGVTASFNPASVTGASSILTFTANATATLGTTSVTVTGTGGGLTRTAAISLTVAQGDTPNFTLSATPPSVTVNRSASATSTIGIARSGGFTGAVALTAGALPTGVAAAFNPASATGASSTLTFTANATATLGTTSVTVTGTGGGLTRTTAISLTVAQAPTGNGGVTVTTTMGGSPPWYNENRLTFNNTAAISAITVTIVVQRTPGITFNGLYNTVGEVTQTSTGNTNAATITYTWTRTTSLPAGTNRLFVAQTNGNQAHPSSGDTWTVSYTSGGQNFTQSGTF